ncbi:MAG: hypothetical protein ACOCPX_03455 [Halapricum sp.]
MHALGLAGALIGAPTKSTDKSEIRTSTAVFLHFHFRLGDGSLSLSLGA